MELDILFENESLIAINKPHGLLVHRSRIAADVNTFALQLLRDQIGQKVYLGHRLDRKTAGVLLFSKSKPINKVIQGLFMDRKIQKTYKAIVRGYVEDCTIDYPLTVDDKTQEAITIVKCIKTFELPLAHGKFSTSRYSLVSLTPLTGRFHQLRKHMSHIFHPIVGDRPHGCNKQNKLWKDQFQMTDMMLHAERLQFEFPDLGLVDIQAPYSSSFSKVLEMLESYHTI